MSFKKLLLKYRYGFLTVFFCWFLVTGCRVSVPGSGDVSVSWELLSNTYSDRAQARAEFIIENNSRFTFTDRNWAMYYSQRPARRLISSEGTLPAVVNWINGDWFKIEPQAGFELGNGEKVTVTYEVSAWWIKEVDAPMGLYFVLYDDDGNEKEIITVDNYEVKPFVRPEQMMRHRNDPIPLNTPEFRYNESSDLVQLDPAELLRVIPSPVRIEADGVTVELPESMPIYYQDGLIGEAEYLGEMLESLTGRTFSVVQGDGEGTGFIQLGKTDFSLNDTNEEGYRLQIHPDSRIVINGNDNAGVFYGIQSLKALMPIVVILGESDVIRLETLTIEDAPRFPYRGLLVDVARNFQDTATMKKIIDIMAFYKINTLHFYLTDDEGWRVEIRNLPELTEVGGQRQHTTIDAPALHPSYGSGPFPYAEGTFGSGYYTQEEFIELLRYAKERHIKVIPSINLPAHARAAIKSMEARYERFMELGDEEAANEFRLIDPDDESEFTSAQSYTDNVVNVARESVYNFYGKVLDGLVEMYREADAPFNMLHTGGDEVAVGAWAKSPMAADLLEQLPDIDDPHNLQAYYSARAISMLQERGLKVGGWEEVAQIRDENGAFVPNPEFAGGDIITYIWRNQGDTRDLAYRLANMGYPVILCHRSNFYFDLAYNNHPEDPGHYSAGFINTRDAWQYAPYNIYLTTLRTRRGHPIDIETEFRDMERLQPEAKENIMGLQAQVWSESVRGPDMIEYYLLPRLAGFAESAWSAERSFETIEDRSEREADMQFNWNIFANTLAQKELPRLSVIHGGFNYRIPKPGAVIENNILKANIKYPGLDIRYTTDGSEPTIDSEKYTGPVEVTGPVMLKAFDRSGRHGQTVKLL